MTNLELTFSILTVLVILGLVVGLAFVTLRIRKVLLSLNQLLEILKRSGKIR